MWGLKTLGLRWRPSSWHRLALSNKALLEWRMALPQDTKSKGCPPQTNLAHQAIKAKKSSWNQASSLCSVIIDSAEPLTEEEWRKTGGIVREEAGKVFFQGRGFEWNQTTVDSPNLRRKSRVDNHRIVADHKGGAWQSTAREFQGCPARRLQWLMHLS